MARLPVTPNKAKGTVGQGGVRAFLAIGGDYRTGTVPADDIVEEGRFLGLVDLYATILHVADVPLPQGEIVDTVSLVPYFADPDQPAIRPNVYTEVFTPNFDPDVGPNYTSGQRAIRRTNYKYIRWLSGAEGLFKLSEDPWETDNLLLGPSLDPDAQNALDELEQELDDLVGVCTLGQPGDPCTSSEDCCSGVCQGSTGQLTCRDPLP